MATWTSTKPSRSSRTTTSTFTRRSARAARGRATATVGRHAQALSRERVATGVDHGTLDQIVTGLSRSPADFTVHPKLERQLLAKKKAFDEGAVDWATAELLALGSLALEGTTVRLAGQDSRRGTFSQRHAVLVDQETEQEYSPLANLSPDQAPFMIYDSLLSEYAALGFEYGYSLGDPSALVLWEAQFGDFVNGAQIVIDQYLAAAEDKWSQRSSLVLLLPHGFDGQGPEHSSARVERFLILCAEDNLRIVQPTTAAQHFHALRRQIHASARVPMVCFTPKRYLRMPATRSSVDELTSGSFHPVLADPAPPETVRRVLICTGKIGHELLAERDARSAPAAVVRVEELYPFPAEEIHEAVFAHGSQPELVWVQDEPLNMGAWNFMRHELADHFGDLKLRPIGRIRSASPATGSHTMHEREHEQLMDASFAGLD